MSGMLVEYNMNHYKYEIGIVEPVELWNCKPLEVWNEDKSTLVVDYKGRDHTRSMLGNN